MRLRRAYPEVFLLLLGLVFAGGNLWFAAARSTIPLRLHGEVAGMERRIEKTAGVDDVFLVKFADGTTVQVLKSGRTFLDEDGEIVGAIAVVFTVGYLAVQIRQNTRAIRASAQQETTRDVSGFLSQVTDNADVARILRVGLQDWDKLDDDERMRFSMLLFRAFFNFQHLFSLHREGTLDPEYWVSQWQVMLWYMKQPGVVRWWSVAKSRLRAGFVEYMEREAAQQSTEGDRP